MPTTEADTINADLHLPENANVNICLITLRTPKGKHAKTKVRNSRAGGEKSLGESVIGSVPSKCFKDHRERGDEAVSKD